MSYIGEVFDLVVSKESCTARVHQALKEVLESLLRGDRGKRGKIS